MTESPGAQRQISSLLIETSPTTTGVARTAEAAALLIWSRRTPLPGPVQARSVLVVDHQAGMGINWWLTANQEPDWKTF